MGDNRNGGWTDERTAEATKQYAEGRSASQIAKALGGGLTRNAVIGKMSRMGLSRSPEARAAGLKGGGKTASRRGPANIRVASNGARTYAMPAPAPLPTRAREYVPTGKPARIIDAGFKGCRWPINEPSAGNMDETLFCCGDRAPGEERYCASHLRIAISPNQPKKPASVAPLGGGQSYRYAAGKRFAE